jgi:putative tryptophan/tyrosine transport system substrate-binding protein
VKRREFITLLGGATTWPLAARAQQSQSAIPVIGFVYPGMPELSAGVVAAFRKGLNETGFIEGRSVTIEFRFAYNDNARLPELVRDLVQRGVSVIVTPASTPAKAVTATVPIVFSIGADPVEIGLVATLNRPGGNLTGISSMNAELGPKRLGLLHELLPSAERFAVLLNPNNRNTDALTKDLQATASAIGKQVEVLTAKSIGEIDAAFASLLQRPADALVVSPDQLLDNRRVQLVTLATHYRMPAIYPFRENVEVGGLMSYGSSAAERDQQVGIYTGRILKGERPADLPVIRAAKFEFVINLQTARILGLDVPATLLGTADEVIE